MICDVNGTVYVDANRLNFFVRSGRERRPRDLDPDDPGPQDSGVLGSYASLRRLIADLRAGRYGACAESDLAVVVPLSEAIDTARAEIERAFATPRPPRALARIGPIEALGYRFRFGAAGLERQERRRRRAEERWESCGWYPGLGWALAETLVETLRVSRAQNSGCLARLRALTDEILGVRDRLPAEYGSPGPSPRPNHAVKNRDDGRSGARPRGVYRGVATRA